MKISSFFVSRKRCAALACLLLGVLAASAVPFGASSLWPGVLSFFGLSDFSSCADGWPASVHVLDVGKADSILIECGGKSMLVDGGTPERGEDVVRYLKQRGTSSLEYVVNTHPDEDHIGGLKYILKSFPVKHFFDSKVKPDLIPQDSAYRDTMDALKRKGMAQENLNAGDKFSLGEMDIRVLGPVTPGESTNNSSVVLLLRYQNIRFLLTGDMEKEEEESLLNAGEALSANVLKVGHHGSSTSTTPEFLQAVHPSYAAISVGYDRNKLPKNDVLERLYRSGIKTYRTDVNGTILFLTDGKTISVKTEK
ncbi:ComEC/Rec2 family competence protein [Caproicibacter fermentans]|uniref:MBL fold metallo-hydrolase n=1 Tax=Caproicibacter fermentans TaxID=2576756 RepID=A0A7G8TBU8_9FIRM|nr:ComEC/Rec2 family competence protein [Caproicibacter fermentans]QNK41089.1 MBL fold metallo-hydrolase [Caproicibacter fermentans]